MNITRCDALIQAALGAFQQGSRDFLIGKVCLCFSMSNHRTAVDKDYNKLVTICVHRSRSGSTQSVLEKVNFTETEGRMIFLAVQTGPVMRRCSSESGAPLCNTDFSALHFHQ